MVLLRCLGVGMKIVAPQMILGTRLPMEVYRPVASGSQTTIGVDLHDGLVSKEGSQRLDGAVDQLQSNLNYHMHQICSYIRGLVMLLSDSFTSVILFLA